MHQTAFCRLTKFDRPRDATRQQWLSLEIPFREHGTFWAQWKLHFCTNTRTHLCDCFLTDAKVIELPVNAGNLLIFVTYFSTGSKMTGVAYDYVYKMPPFLVSVEQSKICNLLKYSVYLHRRPVIEYYTSLAAFRLNCIVLHCYLLYLFR